MKGPGTFVTIKEKGVDTGMPKKKKYNTSILTLGAIWRAYCHAEREFVKDLTETQKTYLFGRGSDIDVRILEYPLNYKRDKTKKCQAKNSSVLACYKFLVPDEYTQYFDGVDVDSASTDLMIGGQRADVFALRAQFKDEDRADEMFMSYEKHLMLILSHVVRILTQIVRNNTVTEIYIEQPDQDENSEQDNSEQNNSDNYVDIEITVKKADSLPAKTFNREFSKFVSDMLAYLLKSDPYKNDSSIKDSKIKKYLECNQVKPIEKLTLFSILSLFSKEKCKDHITRQDFFDTLSYALFDGKGTRKTPIRSSEKNSPEIIDNETIYRAGKYWYEKTKEQGHRFSKLIPNEEILPLAGTLPIHVHADNQNDQPLMTVLEETPGHLYLIGEGGIGKTTAFYHIMEEAYASEGVTANQIPLYVELSTAGANEDFTSGTSFFIRHSIQRQIQALFDSNDDYEKQLGNLFKKKTEYPEYVLLLDGLNEVSRTELSGHEIVQMVIAEIRYLASTYANIRIIVTSRSGENLGMEFTSLYLSGIRSEMVRKFLEDKGDSSERIQKTMENHQLMQILRIPLFLVLYRELKGDDYLLSRGELLHQYFAQKPEGYSERNRYAQIAEKRTDESGNASVNSISPEIISFMLDFIMPELAWNMVKRNDYQISRKEIEDTVYSVLTNHNKTSCTGRYGSSCFDEYIRDSKKSTREIEKDIEKIFGKNEEDDFRWELITKGVRVCLSEQIGVLVTNDNLVYEIVHEHVRDYFASLFHINKLRMAAYLNEEKEKELARHCLSELRCNPLPTQISTFVGEILGELHNVPLFEEATGEWKYAVPDPKKEKCNRNLIKRCLDSFRESLEGNIGYSIYNLFKILQLSREDLSGEDFSNLDLTMCRANGYILGHGKLACNMTGAKLDDSFFLPSGHTSEVSRYCCSPDGNYIATASQDGRVSIWELKTGLQKACFNTNLIINWWFSFNKLYIASDGRESLDLKKWDLEKNECAMRQVEFPVTGGTGFFPYTVRNSPLGTILTIHQRKLITLWDSEMENVLASNSVHWSKKLEISSVIFDPKGREIAFTFVRTDAVTIDSNGNRYSKKDKTVWILDAQTLDVVPDGMMNFPEEVSAFSYDTDGEKFLTASGSEVIIWDVETKKQKQCFQHDFKVDSAMFSPQGDKVLSFSNRVMQVWNLGIDGEKKDDFRFSPPSNILYASFSPDGRSIILHARTGLYVWNSDNYEIRFYDEEKECHLVRFLPSIESKCILAIYGTLLNLSHVELIDYNTGTTISDFSLYALGTIAKDVSFSSSDDAIAVLCNDSVFRIFDSSTHQQKQSFLTDIEFSFSQFDIHDGVRSDCLFEYSPDGTKILFRSRDQISIRDTRMFHEISQITLPKMEAAHFSPEGNRILVSDGVKVLEYEEKDTGLFEEVNRVNCFGSAYYSISKKYVIVQGYRAITIMDRELNVLYEIQREGVHFNGSDICLDNKQIVATESDFDTWLVVWNRYENNMVFPGADVELVFDGEHYQSVQFDMSGRFIVMSGDTGVCIWDRKKRIRIKLSLSDGYARFNRLRNKVVSSSIDGTVKIWDLNNIQKKLETVQKGTPIFDPVLKAKMWAKEMDKPNPNREKLEKIDSMFKPVEMTVDPCYTYRIIPGLEVRGVKITNLHNSASLSEDTIEALKSFGAIVDIS